MGTYMYVRLKLKDENTVNKANESLNSFGFPCRVYNGVMFGFFNSRASLEEDARFMNEDPLGIKQCPHLGRPVTRETLEQFFWNEMACGVIKLSGGETDKDIIELIGRWLQTDDAKQLIDFENSDNIDLKTFNEYGYETIHK